MARQSVSAVLTSCAGRKVIVSNPLTLAWFSRIIYCTEDLVVSEELRPHDKKWQLAHQVCNGCDTDYRRRRSQILAALYAFPVYAVEAAVLCGSANIFVGGRRRLSFGRSGKVYVLSNGGSKNFEKGGGRRTIYQPRPHLSQIHTTIYRPFTRKRRFFGKTIEPIGGGAAAPPPPLNPPLVLSALFAVYLRFSAVLCGCIQRQRAEAWTTLKEKGKGADLYSAYRQYNSTTKRSGSHRVTCKYTTSAFPSYKHSLEGDTAANSFTHLATDTLLIPRPTEGKSLSWPGWLTRSGRLSHEVVTRQP